MRHQVGDDADDDQAFFVYAGVGAGRAGHVHVCEYLLDNGGAEYTQWAAFAGELAAANGHLSVLQWFAEHDLLLVDCEQAYIEAAVHNHYDVMAFLLAHTPDIPADLLSTMLNAAGAHGHLASAQWLRQQGAPWPMMLLFAGVNGDEWREWNDELQAWAIAEGFAAPTVSDDSSDFEVPDFDGF
jgi:ankyrin repeat protein